MIDNRVIEGRAATQDDVDSATCVFFIPDERSLPYSLGRSLPAAARIIRPSDGSGFPVAGTEIQIVQSEIVDGSEILIGFLTNCAEGVCTIEDVELLPDSGVHLS
jgi:hypothetical protein